MGVVRGLCQKRNESAAPSAVLKRAPLTRARENGYLYREFYRVSKVVSIDAARVGGMTEFVSPLKWEPAALAFSVALSKPSMQQLRTRNTSTDNKAYTFKVKTTNPKRYSVRPNVGIAWPGQEVMVTVQLPAMKEYPADMNKCKDKFQVLTLPLKPEQAEKLKPLNTEQQRVELTELWASDDAKAAAIDKFRCTMLFDSSSSTLSSSPPAAPAQLYSPLLDRRDSGARDAAAAGMSANDVINLDSSDDDDVKKTSGLGKRKDPPGGNVTTAQLPRTSSASVGGSAGMSLPVSSSGSGKVDDDDVELVGRKGAIALVDFPHARFNCAEYPFRAGAESAICANCYCYVCDAPARGCPQWPTHCHAVHTSTHWQQRRREWQAAPAVSRGSTLASSSAGSSSSSSTDEPWTCTRVLKLVEQVYPVETPEPAGLREGITLRPYQKQYVCSASASTAFLHADDAPHCTQVARLHAGHRALDGSATARAAQHWQPQHTTRWLVV